MEEGNFFLSQVIVPIFWGDVQTFSWFETMKRLFAPILPQDILANLWFLVLVRWAAIVPLSALLMVGGRLGFSDYLLQRSIAILIAIAAINALVTPLYLRARKDERYLPWALWAGRFQAVVDLIGILLGIHYFPVGQIRLSVLFLILYFGGITVVFPFFQAFALIVSGIVLYTVLVWGYVTSHLPFYDFTGQQTSPSTQNLILETLSAITLGLINGTLLHLVNTRLYRARRTAEVQQQWLARIQQLTQCGLQKETLEDLGGFLVEEIRSLVQSQGALLYLRKETTAILFAESFPLSEEEMEAIIDRLEGEDVKAEPQIPTVYPLMKTSRGVVRPLFLKLPSQEEQWAWLLLWYASRQVAEEVELPLLQQIADVTTLLLARVLATEELHQKVDILSALAERAQRLSRTLDFATLSQLIVDQACEIVRAPRGVLCLLSPPHSEKRLVCAYARNVSRDYLDYVESNYTRMPGFRLLAQDDATIIHFPDVSKVSLPQLHEAARRGGFRAVTLIRVASSERVLGALVLYWGEPHHLQAYERDALSLFASHAGAMLHNAQLYTLLQDEAQTDPLTGLYNRRALFRLLDHEFQRAQRYQRPLSILLIDLDDFKNINDLFGHSVGDIVLRQVAGYLRQGLRTTDIIARYGGDEFVVVLPETDREEAAQVAERIKEAFQSFSPDVPGPLPRPLTLSIGIATYPQDATTPQELIRVADQRMYAHKGGNRRAENHLS